MTDNVNTIEDTNTTTPNETHNTNESIQTDSESTIPTAQFEMEQALIAALTHYAPTGYNVDKLMDNVAMKNDGTLIYLPSQSENQNAQELSEQPRNSEGMRRDPHPDIFRQNRNVQTNPEDQIKARAKAFVEARQIKAQPTQKQVIESFKSIVGGNW